MGDRLRADWDFDDLDATEARFQKLLTEERTYAARAEVLTQLARVNGLRGDFESGERLLAEAEEVAGESDAARIRVDLERGRLRRSSGHSEAALPLFEAAFERARAAGAAFLAADAAHMAALAAPDLGVFVAWTERGVEIAESDESARYWLGPLLNNLGWELYEAGSYAQALPLFERALEVREGSPENRAAIELARYAVGKTLRALGRPAEAATLLGQAVAWAESEGGPDGSFHEELAEDYAALGRLADAGRQAARALELLPSADPSFEHDGERATRLRALASHP